MLNDKQATELISKSLRYELSEEEKKKVTLNLESNEDTREFAKISKVIQNSVAEFAVKAESGDFTVAPGMSAQIKNRLQSSVAKAIEQKKSESQLSATGAMGVDPALTIPVKPGDTRQLVSRFTLLRKLGEGGLGNVWLARDEKLKRNVAIKQMNSSAMETPAAWQRFHREAEITGHLEHPNIVPLYSFGIDAQSGEPFYGMRFVGKRTLAEAIVEYHELLQEGQADEMGLHRLLTAFLGVCQAIAYAHSRGVIHRDLKPENVALDSFGQVIVLDWGLAKVEEDGELGIQLANETSLSDAALAQTMVGEVIGTPLYMAPEQAAGELDKIDRRTDVYGLGAILFAILTGCAPHEKSNLSAGGGLQVADVLRAIAEGATPVPRDYSPKVPRKLEKICLKAMSRKRFARYESASDLADEVERWMAGQNQKQSRYDTLRMEGRELRADMQSSVRDLETNARFMSRLPPIQELMHTKNDEEFALWRERLSTIFSGLLTANGDYQHIVYGKIDGDQFTELVRVERHSTEHANIRSVPKSRLRTSATSEYLNQVIQKKPDEVVSSLVCDPMCDKSAGCDQARLVASVPIYDEISEEPFGFVMIDCDLNRVFSDQMSRRLTACEVVVACDTHDIMLHNKNNIMVEDTIHGTIKDSLPHFVDAVAALQTQSEFIDETDQEIYGNRLWLIPRQHGLMYLLSLKDSPS